MKIVHCSINLNIFAPSLRKKLISWHRNSRTCQRAHLAKLGKCKDIAIPFILTNYC